MAELGKDTPGLDIRFHSRLRPHGRLTSSSESDLFCYSCDPSGRREVYPNWCPKSNYPLSYPTHALEPTCTLRQALFGPNDRHSNSLPLLQSDSLMNIQKPILVVAGILRREDRILICQRRRSDAYGLQWEFPGGKVEPGEEMAVALCRELEEELAIQAELGAEVFRLRHQYPDRYVEVVFFEVVKISGELRNQVFEAIEWAP